MFDAIVIGAGQAGPSLAVRLAGAGMKTAPRGFITVDGQLRTNVPGIWALGDVNGKGALAHTSYRTFPGGLAVVHLGRRGRALAAGPDVRRCVVQGDATRAVHIHPTASELLPTLLGSSKPLGGEATNPATKTQP